MIIEDVHLYLAPSPTRKDKQGQIVGAQPCGSLDSVQSTLVKTEFPVTLGPGARYSLVFALQAVENCTYAQLDNG